MLINRDCKIEKSCGDKYELRENLKHPYFNGKRLIATNGHILAVIPVTSSGTDDKGFVPVDAIKESRKVGKRLKPEIHLNGEAEAISKDGLKVKYPRPNENPVDYMRVLKPAVKESKKPLFKIKLNAKLLKDLADSLGEETLTLCFSQNQFEQAKTENTLTTEKPIFVETKEVEKFGLIMPVKI